MNTIVYGMHWKSQEDAIKELELEGLINIKRWIGKRKNNDINIGRFRQVKFDKEAYSGLNNEIYDDVYNESFDIFLDMFMRNPSQYITTHQESINLYNYLFDYFSNLLHNDKIELLIFYNFPHFGTDYLLTVIAKHMKINTLLMYQSLVPNRFHYITDLNDFGEFKTALVKFDYPHQEINFEHRKVQFYMKNIKPKYKSCNYKYSLELRRYLFNRISKRSFLGLLKGYLDCLVFKRDYNKFKNIDLDFSKKFVYYPLQLQPELTTSTLGGIYSDQILAIEKLSNMIPEDWFIYVKENPKQLEEHRGEYFFKRLSLLKKVKYVSKNVNSFDLIDRCQFVSTISGTAGWEAITANKNCLIFGMAWYQKFEGIFRYKLGLDYKSILENKIDRVKVEQDYNDLIKTTAVGIVDNGHVINYSNYSDLDNTKNLKSSIKQIILKIIEE